MKRYGLVFKIDDQCWLAEYYDGDIENASPIEDNEGVYAELNPREMSLVEIFADGITEEGEKVSLQDLRTITIKHENDPEATIGTLIESGGLPEVARSVFENEEL